MTGLIWFWISRTKEQLYDDWSNNFKSLLSPGELPELSFHVYQVDNKLQVDYKDAPRFCINVEIFPANTYQAV